MEPWIAGRNPVRLKDCGWESRCSHPDPDGLGHSLSHVAAGHYCKKHMLHPFLPFIFARPASPPVRHSGQLTSHASSSTMGGIGLRPAITTISHASHAPTHTTSLASTAWLDMDAHRLTHCLGPRDRKDSRAQGSAPVRAAVERSACLLLAPARETWVNFQKWAMFCSLQQK